MIYNFASRNLNIGGKIMKALIWLRVSTKKQELESQRKELVKLALYDGWKEKDLVYIEGLGASAIKMDELYNKNIETLISMVNNKEVDSVYIWEISRLARDRSKFGDVLTALTKNKVQLVILNPQILRLYSEDTREKVEGITMMVFDFLKNMAEQEMIIKKERFARGREANREKGKFNGGAYGPLYGYEVIEGGYIKPNLNEKKLVNLIFSLYSSGKYSVRSLTDELNKRGYRVRNGRKLSDSKISNILSNTAYIGYNEKTGRVYDAIIDKELFEKCREIRQGNDLNIKSKESKNVNLASKILKCKDCGENYINNGGKYVCYKHIKGGRFEDGKCNNNIQISVDVMDGLLWEVAKEKEIEVRKNYTKASVPELEKEVNICADKVEECQNRLKEIQVKKDRVNERYIDDVNFTKEERDKRLAKLDIVAKEVVEDFQFFTDKGLLLHDQIEKIIAGVGYNIEDLEDVKPEDKKEYVKNYISKAYIEMALVGGRKVKKIMIICKDKEVVGYNYFFTLKDKTKQIVSIKPNEK